MPQTVNQNLISTTTATKKHKNVNPIPSKCSLYCPMSSKTDMHKVTLLPRTISDTILSIKQGALLKITNECIKIKKVKPLLSIINNTIIAKEISPTDFHINNKNNYHLLLHLFILPRNSILWCWIRIKKERK